MNLISQQPFCFRSSAAFKLWRPPPCEAPVAQQRGHCPDCGLSLGLGRGSVPVRVSLCLAERPRCSSASLRFRASVQPFSARRRAAPNAARPSFPLVCRAIFPSRPRRPACVPKLSAPNIPCSGPAPFARIALRAPWRSASAKPGETNLRVSFLPPCSRKPRQISAAPGERSALRRPAWSRAADLICPTSLHRSRLRARVSPVQNSGASGGSAAGSLTQLAFLCIVPWSPPRKCLRIFSSPAARISLSGSGRSCLSAPRLPFCAFQPWCPLVPVCPAVATSPLRGRGLP